jgi:hypothetical protein
VHGPIWEDHRDMKFPMSNLACYVYAIGSIYHIVASSNDNEENIVKNGKSAGDLLISC